MCSDYDPIGEWAVTYVGDGAMRFMNYRTGKTIEVREDVYGRKDWLAYCRTEASRIIGELEAEPPAAS